MAADTLAFLRDVRLRTRIPPSQINYSDAETLAVATEELWGDVAPLIMSEQQEYFVTRSDVALVEGQSTYRIPARAMGAKLRDAVLLNENTGETCNLVRWEPEQVVSRERDVGLPSGFTVEGTSLRLYPTPRNVGDYALRMTFYGRPGALVVPASACKVTAVDTVTGLLTLSAQTTNGEGQVTAGDPDTVLGAGSVTVDVARGTPHYEALTVDAVGVYTVAPARTLHLTPAQVSEVVVGDWVCLPGQAPVVQLPPELHALLVLRTAAVQLAATGDSQGASEASGLAAEKAKRAGALVLPRVDGQPRKQTNGFGRWRGRGMGLWRT